MTRFSYIPNRVIDTDGISDGASIYFYAVGTTIPLSIFSDAGLVTPATNPYVVAAGAEVPPLYFAEAEARVKIIDSSGATALDEDPYDPMGYESRIAALEAASGTYYGPGGTDVTLADGGTGASLVDPNADRMMGWDDSAGAVDWFGFGSGFSITGTTISLAGVNCIPIPASAMTARTTNGAAVVTTETTTNKVMVKSLDYDQTTAEYAQFQITMPERWDEGTVYAQFVWTTPAASGNVVWGLQAVAISNDDPIDVAFGTAQTVTDGATAANDVMVTAATSAVTIAGTPTVGDLVVFQVYRDAASGSDTLAADAKLLHVRLYITTDAGADA